MKLPSLKKYRLDFENRDVHLPLDRVQVSERGLLDELPAPPMGKTGWPWTVETEPSVYDSRAEWPRISIVTPSFNQGQFLEETIRSVLLQNYPNLEYIVMDGGSTDNTHAVLTKYAPWISYSQSEKDNGQGQAINMGFSIASGAYYAWINSDDYYLSGVFNLIIRKFIRTQTDFVYGYGFSFHSEQKHFELVKVMPFWDYFIKIPSLVQPATFWRSEIHQPIWEELHCAIDFELWLRMVKGKKRALIKQPLSVANMHPDAKTSDAKMKEKWQEDHLKIWSEDGHGTVYEWKRIVFLNRIRAKIYNFFN